jgi:hypothetical protein
MTGEYRVSCDKLVSLNRYMTCTDELKEMCGVFMSLSMSFEGYRDLCLGQLPA